MEDSFILTARGLLSESEALMLTTATREAMLTPTAMEVARQSYYGYLSEPVTKRMEPVDTYLTSSQRAAECRQRLEELMEKRREGAVEPHLLKVDDNLDSTMTSEPAEGYTTEDERAVVPYTARPEWMRMTPKWKEKRFDN